MSDPDLPLELYSAVVAALSEGHPLPAVLEHEGLSIDTWETAEVQWVERLQDSAEGDLSLLDAFDKALAEQRKRFSRAVAPLDEDLDQFLAFQRHLATAGQPTTMLAEHGLFLGDWIRLQEKWAEVLAADADARARAAKVLASPDMPPMPTVRPGPRTMPPPMRPRVAAPSVVVSPDAEAEDLVEWGLEALRGDAASAPQPASTEAPVTSAAAEMPPSAPPPLLPLIPVPGDQHPLASAPAAWPEVLAWETPALPPENQALPASEAAWTLDDAAAMTLPPSAVNPAWRAAALHPLPFPRALPSLDIEQEAGSRLPEAWSDGEKTRPPLPMTNRDALPFSGSSESSTHAYVGEDLATRTLPGVSFVLLPALPFEDRQGEEPELLRMPAPASHGQQDKAVGGEEDDATFTMTLPPGRIPLVPALPFQHAPEPDNDEEPLGKTMIVPSPRPTREDNAPEASDDPTATTCLAPGIVFQQPALPFQRKQEPTKQEQDEDDEAGTTTLFAPSSAAAAQNVEQEDDGSDAPTLPPPAGQRGVQKPQPAMPELSLEAHALLCAELALSPGNAEQIFAQYGLSSAEIRKAVDEAWKARLHKDPALYGEWQRLYQRFYAHWRK